MKGCARRGERSSRDSTDSPSRRRRLFAWYRQTPADCTRYHTALPRGTALAIDQNARTKILLTSKEFVSRSPTPDLLEPNYLDQIANFPANLGRAYTPRCAYHCVAQKDREMNQIKLTRHARQRLQQRGSRVHDAKIVVAYGDIEVPAKNGCRYVQLSCNEAASLLREAILTPTDVDCARRLVVLVDPDDVVVTILKRCPDRSIIRRRVVRK